MLIIALLLGGFAFFGLSGNTDHFEETMAMWQKAVQKSVDDDVRRDRALQVLASAKHELKAKESVLTTSYRNLLAIDRRYRASEAEYELAAERSEAAWREVDSLLLKKRAELHRLLTPAEWNAVMRHVLKSIAKVKRSIQKRLNKGDNSK